MLTLILSRFLARRIVVVAAVVAVVPLMTFRSLVRIQMSQYLHHHTGTKYKDFWYNNKNFDMYLKKDSKN